MATNWFDALDEKETAVDVPDIEDTAVLDFADDVQDEPEPDSEDEKEAETKRSGRDKSLWVVGGVVALGVVLVPVLGRGLEAVISGESGKETAAVAGPTAAVSQSPVSAETEAAAAKENGAVSLADATEIGTACEAGSDAVAEEDSVRGATAEFERAYFFRDSARLVNVTAESSPLREQDWAELLPEAAPDGTTWCASFAPIEKDATTVDLDLTMELPGEEPATYAQVVTGKQTPDGWKIVRIDAREQ